ncbi:MAG: hypothetical protein K2Q12_06805 [Rickettsiales bacterium]|nr:hypothetical protein [Rickettsiales bacterium]
MEHSQEKRQHIAKKWLKDFMNRSSGGKYFSMRLTGRFEWPSEFTKLTLFDREWLLWPNTEWDKPGIIVYCPDGSAKEVEKQVFKFLSAFAWVHGYPIDEEFSVSGSQPNPCYRQKEEPHFSFFAGKGFLIDENDYLPFPEDENSQIALALYREALTIDNIAYRFLSFFKILNVKMDGTQQIKWINDNVDKIRDYQAKESLQKLRPQHVDIGNHLYVSGRCAIAHANTSPTVNPDNPDDRHRLRNELPIIKALAELAIEKGFGVKHRSTIWKDHEYELKGFKKVFGPELLELIVEGYDYDASGKSIPERVECVLPRLTFKVRGEPESPFVLMIAKVVNYELGKIWLSCRSEDKMFEAFILLDFQNERIGDENKNYLDLIFGFKCCDNGTTKAALNETQKIRFISTLLPNGQLDVYSESGELLGRKDPYVPVNVDLSGTLANYRRSITFYEQLAMKRTMKIRSRDFFRPEAFLATTTLNT